MHDKIINFFKKISFFSTDPDRDWRVMFSILTVLLVSLLTWNVYFYTKVKGEIEVSETTKPKNTGFVVNEQQEQLKKTIGIFEGKAKKNKEIIDGTYVQPAELSQDPSRY